MQGGNLRLFSLRRHYPDQVSGSVAQTQVKPPSQPGCPKLPVFVYRAQYITRRDVNETQGRFM